MINFTNRIDFSHINTSKMRGKRRYRSLFNTKPWADIDPAILHSIDKNFDLDLNRRAERKFDTLKISEAVNLDIIDILALIAVKNIQWQDKMIARKVATHWWASLAMPANQKALQASLKFIITYHQQPDLYPADLFNKSALTYLSKAVVSDKTTWQDAILQTIVVSIIKEDASSLARIAFKQTKTVSQLLERYQLPINKQFIVQARQHWLNLYFNLSEARLVHYSQALKSYLNKEDTLSYAVAVATEIFTHPYFKQTVSSKLEEQTHKFTDIYQWLKLQNESTYFRQLLASKYLPLLRCWLGTGNYYQLEKAVKHIATTYGEDISKSSRTLNRYIFWKNYQQHILNYWLLIPTNKSYLLDDLTTASVNTRLIKSQMYSSQMIPIIIIEFANYLFIQPLVKNKYEVDLIMANKSNRSLIDELKKDTIDFEVIKNVIPSLIHDHANLWQNDMAMSLEEKFKIKMSNPSKIIVSDKRAYPFPQDYDSAKKQNRLEDLNKWYQNANKPHHIFRRNKDDINKYAISYNKRHSRYG